MKTVAVIAQKGGSGKSTIAVHLAAYARSRKVRPAMIDLDPQASTFDWNEGRTETDPVSPKLFCLRARENDLPKAIQQAKASGAQLLIIDTAPHSNRDAATAAKLSDFVLIPCRPARFDLKALISTAEIARLSNTPSAVVINQAPPVGSKAERAREVIQGQGINVLPPVLHRRTAFEDALTGCRAVHEYDPESKAAQEIAALFDCLRRGLKIT
jgi:chromosome partitioning protein